MINLVFAAVGILLAFYIGVWYTESKCEKILWETIVSLKKEKRESDAAWEKHCKELRGHYENALMQKNGKCTCEQKVLYQDEYEIDPCSYKEIQRFENATVSIRECKKCGNTDIAWYRQENTEEVEVEE